MTNQIKTNEMNNWEGTKVNETDDFELVNADTYEHEIRLNGNILVEFKNNSDAILFYDALIIANKGLTPRELLKQRDELLEALKGSSRSLAKYNSGHAIDQYCINYELIKTIEP